MLVHNFSGDVGLLPVGLFNLGPGAAALHSLVREQHHSVLVIARALDFHGLPDHQRERPVQFREFLRRDQPFGLPAEIHDHARVRDGHDLPGLDLALCRRLMRRGVLLHQLFHLRGGLRGSFAGLHVRFHHVAHVGMFDRGWPVRRCDRLSRRYGDGGRLGGDYYGSGAGAVSVRGSGNG